MPRSAIVFVALVLCISLAACGPSAEEVATMTAAAWTDTPTATATATATATSTPTATATSTPTPIPLELITASNATRLKELGTLDNHGSYAEFTWIGQGELLAVGSGFEGADRRIAGLSIYDISTIVPTGHSLDAKLEPIFSEDWISYDLFSSLDGNRFALQTPLSDSESAFRILEQDGKLVGETPYSWNKMLSADGSRLATQDLQTGDIEIWDISSDGIQLVTTIDCELIDMTLSPDGSLVACYGGKSWDMEGNVHEGPGQLINTETGEVMASIQQQTFGYELIFGPDSNFMYGTITTNPDITVWSIEPFQIVKTLAAGTGRGGVHNLTLSPDGSKLAYFESMGCSPETEGIFTDTSFCPFDFFEFHIFDLNTYRLKSTPPVPLPPTIGISQSWGMHICDREAILFSPDGSFVVSLHEDDILRLWGLETGELLTTIPLSMANSSTTCFGSPPLGFSKDGKILAFSDRDGLHLWGIASP